MTDILNKAIAWIKANFLLAIAIGIAIIIVFFPKLLRHIIGSKRRIHHRTVRSLPVRRNIRHRRNVRYAITGSYRRRPSRRRMKGAKKPWQIKGSRAARLHMAKIRRMR
jgi:hypothetical protein